MKKNVAAKATKRSASKSITRSHEVIITKLGEPKQIAEIGFKELFTIRLFLGTDGKKYISPTELAQQLGVSHEALLRRIKRMLGKGGTIMVTPYDKGGPQATRVIDIRHLPGIIFQMDVSRMRPRIRARAQELQLEFYDVLAAYTFEGVSLNPAFKSQEVGRGLRQPKKHIEQLLQIAIDNQKSITHMVDAVVTISTSLSSRLSVLEAKAYEVVQVGDQQMAMVPDAATALANGRPVLLSPVTDREGTFSAEAIANEYNAAKPSEYKLTAQDVGIIADDLGIRQSIMGGDMTYGMIERVIVGGHQTTTSNARYNLAGKARLHEMLSNPLKVKERAKEVRRLRKEAATKSAQATPPSDDSNGMN